MGSPDWDRVNLFKQSAREEIRCMNIRAKVPVQRSPQLLQALWER